MITIIVVVIVMYCCLVEVKDCLKQSANRVDGMKRFLLLGLTVTHN